MDYITTKIASELWGISARRIQQFCIDRRIDGAKKLGRVWLLPANAEKPEDLRAQNAGEIKRARDYANQCYNREYFIRKTLLQELVVHRLINAYELNVSTGQIIDLIYNSPDHPLCNIFQELELNYELLYRQGRKNCEREFWLQTTKGIQYIHSSVNLYKNPDTGYLYAFIVNYDQTAQKQQEDIRSTAKVQFDLLADVMVRDYYSVFHIDLEEDTYEVLRTKFHIIPELTELLNADMPYTKAFHIFMHQFVDYQDYPIFMKKLSLSSLRHYFQKDHVETFSFNINYNNTPITVKLHLIFREPVVNQMHVIVGFRVTPYVPASGNEDMP